MDEIHGGSERFGGYSKRRDYPRLPERERGRDAPGSSKGSRSSRDQKELKSSKTKEELRKSESRKSTKRRTPLKDAESSSSKKHCRSPERSSRSTVKEADKHR